PNSFGRYRPSSRLVRSLFHLRISKSFIVRIKLCSSAKMLIKYCNTECSLVRDYSYEEERDWKYRLSIYYTKPQDSGVFTCASPRGLTNSITLRITAVHCESLDRQLEADKQLKGRVEGTRLGQSAIFQCPVGFRLNGTANLTCQASVVYSILLNSTSTHNHPWDKAAGRTGRVISLNCATSDFKAASRKVILPAINRLSFVIQNRRRLTFAAEKK
ncbi:hypothetical protein LSTR_LSTR014903, partial [Laodelphax striatellus]